MAPRVTHESRGVLFASRLAWSITKFSALICALSLLAMVALIVFEVVARSLFNYSLQSTEELSGYFLVALAFLGLVVAVYEDALFRAEFLIERLTGTARRVFETAFLGLFIALVVVVDYEAIALVVDSYGKGYVASTLLATPLYIPQTLLPVGLTSALVVLVVKLVEALCGAPLGIHEAEDEYQ